MLLVYLSCAWVAGIFLGSRVNVPPALALFGLAPLPLLFFIHSHRKPVLTISLCFVLLLSGAAYYQSRLPLTNEALTAIPWITGLRGNLAEALAQVLPEPQAALAQGIILGIRSNIPASLQVDFARTGTTHILAISGQNLSIVAGILVGFGVWLFGRKHYIYIWLALATLWVYSLLTGMQPPVVRAAIMAGIFLFADLLGRQRTAFTALAFAAAIMVGASPGVLWDVSFQLSFLAMSGLVFIFPPLQSLGRKLVEGRLGEEGALVSAADFVVDGLGVSLAAVIAVWPLTAHYFGIVSWVGPVATFFAVPVFPGIIVVGALAGAVGLVALPVAQVIAWVAWLFLSYMLLVVRVFSGVPVIQGIRFDAAPIVVYYSVLSLGIWFSGHRDMIAKLKDWLQSASEKAPTVISRVPLKWAVPALAVGAVLVWSAVATLPDDNLHASFLDVGQGDAALFQIGSQQVLVDGGPNEEAIMLALGKEMPFWDRTIELVILTHPDADHRAGLEEVLKRYNVKQVLYAQPDEESPVYGEWLRQIDGFLAVVREKKIKPTLAQAGQEITFGSATIDVLNPPASPFRAAAGSDIDDNGVVVRVEMGDVSFLITGDVQWQAESDMVTRRANLASTVLKAGHHGSATSTGQAFLEVVNPRVAIISAGKDNPYGHPHKEVMERLREKMGEEHIYRTDEDGTIELTTDGTKLWISKEQ